MESGPRRGLTLLRALGVDARRAERIVTDALDVIDAPRALRLASG